MVTEFRFSLRPTPAPPLPDLPPDIAGRPAVALTLAWWGDPEQGEALLYRVPCALVEQRGAPVPGDLFRLDVDVVPAVEGTG